jgi:ubiquinone/menaquinone biosynthesis C-methylase UbiE
MPHVSFDPVADTYDASQGYPPATAEAIGAALFAAAGGQPGTRVLELGVGTGRIAIPLLALGANVTGVDISPRMLDRLRTNLAQRWTERPNLPWGTLDLKLADMSALPFADGAFDAVVIVHVLHLTTEWRRVLDEALRVLRPGGCLLLGQDEHSTETRPVIERQWLDIVRALDPSISLTYIGAGYSAVAAELRARGLVIEETRPVSWAVRRAPADVVNRLARRGWSRTWDVPDDIFAESIRQLEAWARQEYGATLDEPREEPAAFVIARVVKPE